MHSSNLLGAFTNQTVTCPNGHDTNPPTNACVKYSIPVLANDLFFQNRSFYITDTPVVQLNPGLNQAATGGCPTGASYWDIGVYNDKLVATDHSSGLTLDPEYSMLTSTAGYSATNIAEPTSAGVVSQYCNGSRVPPEIVSLLCSGPNGFANAQGCIQPGTVGVAMSVPPGVPDSLTPPLPVFALAPSATVDEGSNWINMFYGPLSLTNPTIQTGGTNYGLLLGNYALAAGSPAIAAIPTTSPTYELAPETDFFGNPRPTSAAIDIGAVEYTSTAGVGNAPTLISIYPNTGVRGTAVNVTLTGINLTGTTAVAVVGLGGFTVGNFSVKNDGTVTATLTISPATLLGNHSVNVVTPGGTSENVTFTVLGGTATFGPVPVLTTTPASITPTTGTITVTNTPPTGVDAPYAGPITLIAAPTITPTGPAAGTFTITGGTCVSGFVIIPSASCTITVQYAPGTSTATASAHVTITDSGAPTVTQNSPTFQGN